MRTRLNNTTILRGFSLRKVTPPGRRGEETDRYLTQLYIMLRTARRQNNRRVVSALRELIAGKKGAA
jgi:hypothetical protein